MPETPKFMMVFNADKFIFDNPSMDDDCFDKCEILHEYEDESDGEKLAIVKWPDGLISRGEPINSMKPIKENA